MRSICAFLAILVPASALAAAQPDVDKLVAAAKACADKESNQATADCYEGVGKQADALMAAVVKKLADPLAGKDAHGRDQAPVRRALEAQQRAFLKYRDDAAELAAALDGGTASDQLPVVRKAKLDLTLQRVLFLDSFIHD